MKNKGVEWSTIPWNGSSFNLKAIGSRKSPSKRAEDLQGYLNCVVDSNEWARWMVASLNCKLTQMREQCVTVELPYISRDFWWLTVDSAVVLSVSQMLQFYYSPSLFHFLFLK